MATGSVRGQLRDWGSSFAGRSCFLQVPEMIFKKVMKCGLWEGGIQILALKLGCLLKFLEPPIPICKMGMMSSSQCCFEEGIYPAWYFYEPKFSEQYFSLICLNPFGLL